MRLSKVLLAISIGAVLPSVSIAALGISYDQANYQELPQNILYPFSYQGMVSVRENNFSDRYSSLPKEMPEYWDVVAVGRDILEKECGDNGRLEVLNYDNLPHKDFLVGGALQKCGVGFSLQGMALSYALVHKYGVPPTYWTDIFDFNRFPGKRALPKQARYLFEVILLADGVKPSYVYPLLSTKEGQDRALNKLDTIYDDIIWWNDTNSLKLWMEQGFVAMAVAPDGAMLSRDGVNVVGVSRQQVLYEMRYYSILKQSEQKDLAYAFISYATQPDQQLHLSNHQYYGPTIKQSWRLVSPEVTEYMTNNPKNIQGGILLDYEFYKTHGEALEARFNEWLSSKEAPVKRVSMASEIIDVAKDPVVDVQVQPEVQEFYGPQLIEFIGPSKDILK